MKNLPIGGVWKGKVKLHSNSPAQDDFANITLNTLDPNHIDVSSGVRPRHAKGAATLASNRKR